MPTVIIVNGYRLYFVSFDGSEPMHIHVRKENRSAKIWLSPLKIAWTDFNSHESRAILRIVEGNAELIKRKWNEHFNQ